MAGEQLCGRAEFTEFIRLIEKNENLTSFVQNCGKYEQLVDDVIKNLENMVAFEVDGVLYEGLFRLYQHGSMQSQLFVLQFAPSLISAYLSLIGSRILTGGGRLETLLLSIYNKEANLNKETPFAKSYRIPSLSNSSIYHEPLSSTSSALTEGALSRHEQSDKPILMNACTKVLHRISAGSRSDVLNTILGVYNSNLSGMTESSHTGFCKMVTRMARSGFPHLESDDQRLACLFEKQELDSIKHYTRIKLSNVVYQQMLTGLYFIMYDGLGEIALVALKSLETMARSILDPALTMTLKAIISHVESSFKESEAPYFRNPMKSTRRQIDSTKRRYAFTTSPALLTPDRTVEASKLIEKGTDTVDVGIKQTPKTKTEIKDSDSPVTTHRSVDAENIAASADENLGLSDNRGSTSVPSESEDDANENTTLLGDSVSNQSDAVNGATNHERIQINIIADNDEGLMDVINMEVVKLNCPQTTTGQQSEMNFDTLL